MSFKFHILTTLKAISLLISSSVCVRVFVCVHMCIYNKNKCRGGSLRRGSWEDTGEVGDGREESM